MPFLEGIEDQGDRGHTHDGYTGVRISIVEAEIGHSVGMQSYVDREYVLCVNTAQ
jgi:hypothetical protein